MQGNGSFQTKINPSNVDDYFQFLEEIWIFEISSKNTLLTLTTQFYSSYLEILLFPLPLFQSFFFFNYWFYFMFILLRFHLSGVSSNPTLLISLIFSSFMYFFILSILCFFLSSYSCLRPNYSICCCCWIFCFKYSNLSLFAFLLFFH